MMLSWLPLASRAFCTTLRMSAGAINWPFFMLTGLPDFAQAIIKSVWRHKKAGVCSTSTTAATSFTCCSVCTSVNTGTPIWRRTSSKILKPCSSPNPLNVLLALRLALSKDDLYINGMAKAVAISFSWPALSMAICSDSMTQGPAIKNKGWSRPTSKLHNFI